MHTHHPSTVAPKEKVVIEISSDTKPDPKLEDTIREVVEMDEDREEDPEEDSEEAPQDAKVEEDPEEDPEEKQDEVEEHFRGEDDYKDYWQLEDSKSENVLGDDPRFWNYDDLSDWQNAEPADSSARMILCLGHGLKYADDLSNWSLRAWMGGAGVNSDAVNAMSLLITRRP
ncbi:hypothetical protein PIB30_089341 [Stylosanthes scabra]|uniref:Uncharacterized protein n=1 Tax=Stylosanthes scabra TaxID=79078 RepID=A0ABU6XV40_9FABA|nr:hypothetical protein [Stylosanthes scabra]